MIVGLFALLFGAIFLVLAYPLILLVRCACTRPRPVATGDQTPLVSVIIAARNAAARVGEKISNCEAFEYPEDKLEFVCFSDGSTDGTLDVLERHASPRLKILWSREHVGKVVALNEAVAASRGEILVFTDVATRAAPNVMAALVRYFTDPTIGGVACRVRYGSDAGHLETGVRTYLGFDTLIKRLEARNGSVSANTGQYYAIRRALFQQFPGAVADDLFSCLAVVRQQRRFYFDPHVAVLTPPRVKSATHEVARRRRIVAMSLRGIWLMRAVLNPFRYGFFSFSLFINKVLRRLMPIHLCLLFLCSILLAGQPVFLALAWLQFLTYATCLVFAYAGSRSPSSAAEKLASAVSYFLLGNVGTFLGVVDFLSGRAAVKWEPVAEGPAETLR
jgi:cellulose synthase/poly-beta-1,6-N-acetylglucosamine synthase-like glycosyltransferase